MSRIFLHYRKPIRKLSCRNLYFANGFYASAATMSLTMSNFSLPVIARAKRKNKKAGVQSPARESVEETFWNDRCYDFA